MTVLKKWLKRAISSASIALAFFSLGIGSYLWGCFFLIDAFGRIVDGLDDDLEKDSHSSDPTFKA